MQYTAVSVRQLDRKGKPWQARAKYKDLYGKWKEDSKMLPEAKGKKEANRMAKEWLDQLNAEGMIRIAITMKTCIVIKRFTL